MESCDPIPRVPVLSRGAERNLNQPQQLRRKPHRDVTSAKDKPTSFYAKVILRRPGDEGWMGMRLPWPSAPTTLTTMGDTSGERLYCQGIPEPACKTGTTLWWDDERFPLLPGSVP